MRVADDFDFGQREIEANEELEFVAWAENHGWIARKMQYQGRRSCPDRFFFGYGQIIPVEMKRPNARKKVGGGLSVGQREEFRRLGAVGVTVHVFYTAAEGIAFLKSRMVA